MSDTDARSVFDRPNSYIGRTVPRPNARRLVAGRGTFVDDIQLPRMLHIAFVRSPYAHAGIGTIDVAEALAVPGVVRIFTGAELAGHCKPWRGVLGHLQGLKSAPQPVIAVDRATWQGEPVAAVVAATRAEAEDGAALVLVDWQELPTVADMQAALEPESPVIHEALGSNLAWRHEVDAGDVEAAFARAAHVVETTLRFNRHTGVTLEPRSLIADYDSSEERLTVHYSGQ
ncbi:MAG: xanthine dehydrogenase family protein molybdopterin-binding subunit, partial [Alphaproteobacteria bacterium]